MQFSLFRQKEEVIYYGDYFDKYSCNDVCHVFNSRLIVISVFSHRRFHQHYSLVLVLRPYAWFVQ